MTRIWSTELGAHAGQRVELAGWLHRFRQLSRVSFLVLPDGQGLARENDEGEEEPIRTISEDEAVVEAGTNIEDVNNALGIALPHEESAAVSRALVAGRQWDEVLAAARAPELRWVVSNTAEAGYNLDLADGPDGAPPRSFPAKLLLVLHERFRAGRPGGEPGRPATAR